jgi:hypothetical protein
MKRGKNIGICNVISKLVERKKNLKEVGNIFIMEWNLFIRKKVKYVLLKMCKFYFKYLWALMKSLEIWYA